MTVSELIAELQKYPPETEVTAAIEDEEEFNVFQWGSLKAQHLVHHPSDNELIIGW